MANKREIKTAVQNTTGGLIRLEVTEKEPGAYYRNVYLLTRDDAKLLLDQLTEYVI